MFNRILVANRGEIALRVIRACHDLGIEAVAVYSEADRGAPWLDFADQAVCIGPAVSAQSYLNIPRIIATAEKTGAQAIHPGYGFLSENSKFAEQCRDSGIEFIGPPVGAMDRLGNKDKSKTVARAAKVPTVPGSDGLVETEEQAKKFANMVGYPVLVKASAGGGGRGMRVARDDASLATGLSAARAEAEAAFKDGSVFLEKYLDRPRHVEVQLIGDQHGNVIHLFERDCSLQRRHQKLVEESPSPNLPDSVRQEMCAAAVRLAKEAGYYNAGTCEFLVDQQNNYYFIEVNARVQVEHPVTELVTGVDVIREQIRVAAGEKLRYEQKDVQQRGHAIEVRINAEDPAHDFRPSAGTVKTWRPPGGPGVRIDSHVCAGYRVPPNYDSMVAKLLVHQPTRAEAFAVMRRCLREFVVEGIHTTIPILKTIFDNEDFIAGNVDTTYIERVMMPPKVS
ncbi:Biotin carboxylase [Gemmata obscuriglobus]|uniref:Biotin carboxylase n=2 Tax=Gemmata TaxID=113 RepID=A0A2Z3HAR8_9BACT|nr:MULTISPECIES: acetyl-CoA carboxylase biotin carboxylase subunit [Gemmata]AWM42051.1 acetyl-CoA carboxylase biotin carboxylase subunit [Gemmata obscuriglobus]MDY3554684.1 acetyl-CoA carboxylase biotin carboxylase subunit [Gemmata algarum]MDY3559689.1 acetyl-CoA carboxylase biotin carboxylase subunit [Gemmata algarum]QEG31955.1 Biotin carboxylase [Gemmata obscuriglobus]VTS11305.1 acetyl- carboxylase subunit alpha : Acetyl-CoA carboxylase, biotin carboxylase OS=Planctomyces limnophilus (strain